MRRPGIFGEGGQHRAGQLQTAGIGRALQAGNDAEALRVALVALEIGALRSGEIMAFEQAGNAEPFADRILAGMAERRIADVVRQAGGGDDGAEIARFDILQPMPGDDFAADHGAQRATDATGLQAVRQAGAHVIALRQRENLGLVLQPAEGRGEHDAVVILLEGGALRRTRRLAGAQALAGEQFFPDFLLAHVASVVIDHGRRVYSASSKART